MSPRFPVALLILGLICRAPTLEAAPTIDVPAGIDHAQWSLLLERYVDDRGAVDYAGWKASGADSTALTDYIAAFAATDGPDATGDEEIAALINAYNACTIRWILDNFPTRSIRETSGAWTGARWNIGGRRVSLDEIEHQNLRPLYGWKVHATIVCAARSCPPLQREAYTAANLARLTAQAHRAWLGRDDLNRYDIAAGKVHVSPIFKWFKEDFRDAGTLARVLEAYGPESGRALFRKAAFSVGYLDYDWGLNDQGTLGEGYVTGLSGFLKRLF